MLKLINVRTTIFVDMFLFSSFISKKLAWKKKFKEMPRCLDCDSDTTSPWYEPGRCSDRHCPGRQVQSSQA